jgi:glycosyltransferase involved in cell wall biosynthesis
VTLSASVVIPVRNAEATISDCVDSLLKLDTEGGAPELVVVDNGSTDGTLAALRAFGDGIVLLHEQRRGAAAARNTGIAGSRGEVIAFTDADCTVDPDWLALLVAALDDPGVGVAGGTILAATPANEVERFGEVIHDHRSAIEVYSPPYAITMSWASPRAVLEQTGGFDLGFLRGQDVDLSYRIVQAGYELAFVPGAVVHHRNESTLGGLFREGFVHGFHGVKARKRHREFLHGYGHARGGSPRLRQIGSQLMDWARGRDAPRARCEATFNSGKKAGRLLGSARFGRLDV